MSVVNGVRFETAWPQRSDDFQQAVPARRVGQRQHRRQHRQRRRCCCRCSCRFVSYHFARSVILLYCAHTLNECLARECVREHVCCRESVPAAERAWLLLRVTKRERERECSLPASARRVARLFSFSFAFLFNFYFSALRYVIYMSP